MEIVMFSRPITHLYFLNAYCPLQTPFSPKLIIVNKAFAKSSNYKLIQVTISLTSLSPFPQLNAHVYAHHLR